MFENPFSMLLTLPHTIIFMDASAIDISPIFGYILSYREIMESTLFGKRLTELLETSEGGDVTLNCMGEVFKAHSFILSMRCHLFIHHSLEYTF